MQGTQRALLLVWQQKHLIPGGSVREQGGTVSTMALDFGVSLVFCPSGDSTVRMASQTFAGTVEFSLGSIPPRQTADGTEEANWCVVLGNPTRERAGTRCAAGAACRLTEAGHD